MSALGAAASGILFAQPVCCAAVPDHEQTLVLHLGQPGIPCTAPERDTTTNLAGAATAPAAGSELLSATASCRVPSSSSSGRGRRTHGVLQDDLQQPLHQLQGMLFHGPRLMAHYSWPLPSTPEGGQVLTVAAQLPSMSQPCVLELVLVYPTGGSAGMHAQAEAAEAARPAAAPPGRPPAAATNPYAASGEQVERSRRTSGVQLPPAVTRCPVVYLPPAAVQEVQQLLLPAMQQEVLEGWAGSQAGATTAGTAAEQTPGGMPLPLLQAAVWQHWQALADDLGLVLGLQQRRANEQARGPQGQAQQQRQHRVSTLMLQDVLPNLLGFLLRQGLQQVAALVQLAAQEMSVPFQVASPPPTPPTAAAMAPRARAAWQATPASMPSATLKRGGSGMAARRSGRPPLPPSQGLGRGSSPAGVTVVVRSGSSTSSSSSTGRSQLQEGPGTGAVHGEGGDTAGSSSSHGQESGQRQEALQHKEGSSDSAASPHTPLQLTAATCWTGFPSHLEEQYVAYKHQQYLWLDRYAAWFTLLWICVLLVRMVWEQDPQGIIMYLGFLLGKAAPYTLLVTQSAVNRYQRQREVLLAVVSQVLCLAPIVLGALLVDPTITLPLIQGASWAIAWCQQHASRLLQAWVLLQARWPQLGAVWHLPGAEQLGAAATAAAAALSRSPAAMLQLHQHAAAAIKVPESPMRSFWRIYGEYQVLVPMAIPRHVRLWYFVPSMLAETAGNCYVFSWVFPWWQVVLRFTPALLLTIGVAWWFDWYVRGKFVGHLQQLEQQRVQQLAAKLKGLGEDG